MESSVETEEVFAEDDTEEEEGASDTEERVVRSMDEKRRRRVSDVIDTMGDHERSVFPEGFTTPRRQRKHIDPNSPDQGYSTTPDLKTPDSVKAFVPQWLNKTPEMVDAAPSTFTVEPSQTILQDEVVATMPVEIDADCYNMNHKYRGKCVVFNHEFFDTGFANREGSSIDAKRIEQTFQNLGFEVEIYDNLEHAGVIDKINQLSNADHNDSDCICIFMLTHGISNDMICAKDVAYKSEKIWKPFTGDKCKSLAGKPKLFFLQACRGNEVDSGVTLMRNNRRGSETDSVVTSYKIPTHADFLIAHSSAQGFFSWRNPTNGTWFVQCLCEVLNKYADTKDLLKMLTITTRKICTERASYDDVNFLKHDKKQVPSITSMLTRDVYFTPK